MHIKSKQFYLFTIVLIIVTMLVACQTSNNIEKSEINLTDKVILTEKDTGEDIVDTAIYDGFGYMVGHKNIIRYNLVSGEREVLSEDIGNISICIEDNNIYTYNREENAVIRYSLSGEKDSKYPLPFEPFEADRMIIYEDTIIISSRYVNENGYSESELYKLNLSSGEGEKIDSGFKGKDSFSLIKGLDFIDKNTIMISSYATTSTINMIVKGYQFDIQNEKVNNEYILPYSSAYSYDEASSGFYYINNGMVNKYDINSLNETIIGRIDKTLLDIDVYFIKKFFYSAQNAILWDSVNNCFIIVDLSLEIEPLRIILSDDVSFDLNIEPIVDQFEAEYGCPVYITKYPQDTYKDKLRTKLLAADSDFDIYIVKDITSDNLLTSILNHNLYEPLDRYDKIIDNFSNMYNGIREMMSHNQQVFAIPYYMQIYSTVAIKYDLNLCDKMIESNEQNASVFRTSKLIRFIDMFVQEAIDQNNFDKATLTDMLERIRKYSEIGVLYDITNTNEHLMEDLYMYFDAFVTGRSLPEYPEFGTIIVGYNNKSYIYLQGSVFMNKASTNKEMAANFIEVLTRSDNIYDTNVYRCTLLGPDVTKYDIYKNWSTLDLTYLEDLPYIYENAKIYTYDYLALNGYIHDNLIDGFEDGSISIEEAVDIIVEWVNYTYFE